MSNVDVQALKSNFTLKFLLSKALIQLLPANDRYCIRTWLEEISGLDTNVKELIIRDAYMKYILLMLESGKIDDYFKKLPPLQIEPIESVIPQKVRDDLDITNDENRYWTEKLTDTAQPTEPSEKTGKVVPEKFLETQPLPHEGIICYFGAFSDQR